MITRNSRLGYGAAVIALHWLTLLLLVAVYSCMELRGWAPKGSALRDNMKSLHYLLGLTVLVVVTVRLAVRWAAGAAPPIEPPLPAWQEKVAHLMHVALYAFLFAMPILGWLTLSAGSAKPILLFGVALPALLAPDEALGKQIKEIHETIATVGYFLVGLHAAAALVHHYLRRDNTLLRMLPRRRSEEGNP